MIDTIEPALSVDEWADRSVRLGRYWWDGTMSGDDGCVAVTSGTDPQESPRPISGRCLPALIALANAALPDTDPRKIRRGWIIWLQEEADVLKRNGAGAGALMAREIADALASYLPPETV